MFSSTVARTLGAVVVMSSCAVAAQAQTPAPAPAASPAAPAAAPTADQIAARDLATKIVKATLEQSEALNSIRVQMRDQINFVAESVITEHASKKKVEVEAVLKTLTPVRMQMMADLNKTWPDMMEKPVNDALVALSADPALNQGMINFYVRNFTLAELKELHGIITSPVLKKNQQLNAQVQALMNPRIGQVLMPLLNKVSAESAVKQTEIVRDYIARSESLAAAQSAASAPAAKQ